MTTSEGSMIEALILDKFQAVERAQRLQREAIERVEKKQREDNEAVKASMARLEKDAEQFRIVVTDIHDMLEFFKDSRDAFNHVAKITKFAATKRTWLYAAGVMFIANWLPDLLPNRIPWPF